MADLSFDCDAPHLLCTETNNLDFDGLEFVATDDLTHQTDKQNLESNNVRSDTLMGFFPFQIEEVVCLMFEREREHLPKDDYLYRLRSGNLDLRVRREALGWIRKAHTHHSFGAPTVCLAINYLDRFLSVYELPRGKTWTVQLLAVACLSLAAKMEEIKVPSTVDLQVGDPEFVFEGKTIKRMELLVLSTLKWRMQACTPCSFIDYFLRKINSDLLPSRSLINRSILFILSAIKGIDFLEFRPSEIAAAVAMCVSGEIQPIDIDKAMSCFIHVEKVNNSGAHRNKNIDMTNLLWKVRVLKCLELIQDLTLISETTNVASAAVPSVVPQSPVGVLDAACFSYKSDERTVGSCLNSSHTSPDTKRRKLDRPSRGDLNS